MANDAGAVVCCASTVEDRGHKENAILDIRDAIRDSRITEAKEVNRAAGLPILPLLP